MTITDVRSFHRIPFSLVLIDLMIHKYHYFHVNDIFYRTLDLYHLLEFFTRIIFITNKYNK